jgi:hypothetical protein
LRRATVFDWLVGSFVGIASNATITEKPFISSALASRRAFS